MALASAADVEKALQRDLTTAEADHVEDQLEEASDLVLGYLGCPSIADPVPGPIVRVVASMVAALLRSSAVPENTDQITAGEYSLRMTEGSTSKGPWLTKALMTRLHPYRCTSGVSVPLVSERFVS